VSQQLYSLAIYAQFGDFLGAAKDPAITFIDRAQNMLETSHGALAFNYDALYILPMLHFMACL